MDSTYICRHLKRLLRVMYKESGTGYYAREIEGKRYEFGCETPPIHNEVCRAVAIYLACGNPIKEKDTC